MNNLMTNNAPALQGYAPTQTANPYNANHAFSNYNNNQNAQFSPNNALQVLVVLLVQQLVSQLAPYQQSAQQNPLSQQGHNNGFANQHNFGQNNGFAQQGFANQHNFGQNNGFAQQGFANQHNFGQNNGFAQQGFAQPNIYANNQAPMHNMFAQEGIAAQAGAVGQAEPDARFANLAQPLQGNFQAAAPQASTAMMINPDAVTAIQAGAGGGAAGLPAGFNPTDTLARPPQVAPQLQAPQVAQQAQAIQAPMNPTIRQPEAAAPGQKVIDVYLLGGQSNAVGLGEKRLEAALEKTLGEDTEDHETAVFMSARGATNLHTQWKADGTQDSAGDGSVYKTFQTELDSYLTKLQADNPDAKINIQGMFWHQGESDVLSTQANQENYGDNLARFIQDVRATTGEADLPFMIGRLSDNTKMTADALARVQQGQDGVAAADRNTVSVNMDDAEPQNIHFTQKGYDEMADLFANAYANNFALQPQQAMPQNFQWFG